METAAPATVAEPMAVGWWRWCSNLWGLLLVPIPEQIDLDDGTFLSRIKDCLVTPDHQVRPPSLPTPLPSGFSIGCENPNILDLNKILCGIPEVSKILSDLGSENPNIPDLNKILCGIHEVGKILSDMRLVSSASSALKQVGCEPKIIAMGEGSTFEAEVSGE